MKEQKTKEREKMNMIKRKFTVTKVYFVGVYIYFLYNKFMRRYGIVIILTMYERLLVAKDKIRSGMV